MITIVGLGPGDPAHLTRQAWELFSQADELYLRTGRHPTVIGLPAGVKIHTFDAWYEAADDFAAVYQSIVERVLALGRRPGGVLYAVPGHPLVGEATVTALLEQAPAAGLEVRIVAGLSFIEPVLTALELDGMNGLQVVDALDIALCFHPPLNPDAPALLGQLYSCELASDVKLTLMNQYPNEHVVHLVHAAGTAEELIETIPLYQLDRCSQIAHLSSLYVPPLPRTSGFESFQETIARLRGPDGCPWDQEQTHQSLRPGLVEETAEVLDALDAENGEALCEELGDLLLHVVLHAQIAAEEGDFTAADIIAGIEAKIRRRHPHVFGAVEVSSVDQVLANWDAIKEQEKEASGDERASTLDGVPAALPALARADKLARKAAGAGFDWTSVDGVIAKVREEMGELLAAKGREQQAAEMGDLLFAVVNWARWLGLDAETTLRTANRRFRQRFQELERLVKAQGQTIAQLDKPTIKALWQEAKPGREE